MVCLKSSSLMKWLALFIIVFTTTFIGVIQYLKPGVQTSPRQILVDTDVDTDDIFALLYLLKLKKSEFDVKAVTINTNGWTNAGHAVNHILPPFHYSCNVPIWVHCKNCGTEEVYDLLFMMGRDDIPVGVGGEGGISENGTIFPNVGGYLPIIEQGMTTMGYCRYRQAIPLGPIGRLHTDTNYGLRKAFLPQGSRRYIPVIQPTAQEVMINAISEGPTTVFLIGAHTNFALFLMRNPHLKKNVEHIYVMGGGVRSKNPSGCCSKNAMPSCQPSGQCGDHGNLFSAGMSNPYAEFNIFANPFAAYQVIHSGIPVTLIPLDATNTIPITKEFFETFEKNQITYEAQYCFKSLKLVRGTASSDDRFYKNFFMWDSFMAGVAVSIMRNPQNANGENEFAEMEYMNITVHTSNEPYGVSDGSNPFFTNGVAPKFNLKNDGVHSGHVQNSLQDPFCLAKNNKGICKDGYTEEISGPEGVRVLVATKAKPNKDPKSTLNREFFSNFLEVLNHPRQSGRFNFTTQFPHHKEVFHKPYFGAKKTLGKPIIFDMDMSAGDFLALLYLLKVPVEELNLQAILVTPTGWANAATIDVVYDLLHMMGRDDIPVGLGDVYGMNQTYTFPIVGDCKYAKEIPHGSGGFLDSDTLYGLATELPRSPRRYIVGDPVTPQPLAMEVWENVTRTINFDMRVTILTNGPLTTLAKILARDENALSKIKEVYVVGGYISNSDGGNYSSVPPSNKNAEFNMYLDPLAAKTVIESKLPINLIAWGSQDKVTSFRSIMEGISQRKSTPEVSFAHSLISKLYMLRKENHRYQHVKLFVGEILGVVILASGSLLNSTFDVKPITVVVTGDENVDAQMVVDIGNGTPIKVLKEFDHIAYYGMFADRLADGKQSMETFSKDSITYMAFSSFAAIFCCISSLLIDLVRRSNLRW